MIEDQIPVPSLQSQIPIKKKRKGGPGGARDGSGRKQGQVAVLTHKVREYLWGKCEDSSYDPFLHLIDIAKNGEDEATRFKAAVEIASFIAPKLKSIEVKSEEKRTINISVLSLGGVDVLDQARSIIPVSITDRITDQETQNEITEDDPSSE